MSQLKSIERLSLMLNFINVNRYPNLDDILNYLIENNLETTERTIQRDFKTLREICFINVKYSRSNNGYWIDETCNHHYSVWKRIFEMYNRTRVLNEALLNSKTTIESIHFDINEQEFKADLLEKLLLAINYRKKIKFILSIKGLIETKEVIFYPHVLRVYSNYWYVFGCFPNYDFTSIGLDRILNLEVLSESFKLKHQKPKELIDSFIGLDYPDEKIEKIVLVFEASHGKYIKSQPIHPSQKILIDTDKELRIELRLKINFELEEQIIKHGEFVRVLEPKSFRKLIKNRLKKALAGYKS